MNIRYTEEKCFTQSQVQGLFQSVQWLSGNYPQRLLKALEHCPTVITAWDGDQLVGLINAIDDGELTAYAHYLCVRPEYQKCGIGKELLCRLKEKYKDYLYLLLLAEKESLIGYYEKNGFEQEDWAFPMVILNK